MELHLLFADPENIPRQFLDEVAAEFIWAKETHGYISRKNTITMKLVKGELGWGGIVDSDTLPRQIILAVHKDIQDAKREAASWFLFISQYSLMRTFVRSYTQWHRNCPTHLTYMCDVCGVCETCHPNHFCLSTL